MTEVGRSGASAPSGSSPKPVEPQEGLDAAHSIPIAKASVQKVGAVLRKAGFERSRVHRSGRIRGWSSSTPGYQVRLHWNGYVLVSHIEHRWARGTDAEREAQHERMIDKLIAALIAGGLAADRHKAGYGWSEIRIPLAQGIEARRAETRSGSVVDESPVGEADAPKGDEG